MATLLDGTVLPVFSTGAMREADRGTIEDLGIPGFTLMERASLGVFDRVRSAMAGVRGKRTLVLAGSGGNGGDGLAVARMLACAGADVRVLTTATPDAREDTARNLRVAEALASDPACTIVVERVADEDEVRAAWQRAATLGPFDVVVDAVLGIGAGGALREPVGALCALAAEARARCTVSVDVPSGVHSDTGACEDPRAVRADVTVTMAALKPGLLVGEGRERAGEVEVVDIGIPPARAEAAVREPGSGLIPTDDYVRSRLPRRALGAHKFGVGQLLAVVGSDRYPGAAVLACRAAARIGAGYVSCATTERAARAVVDAAPEVAALRLDRHDADAAAAALEAHRGARAMLVGPGLGRADGAGALVRALLDATEVSLVLDADGLNAIADAAGLGSLGVACARLREAGRGVVVTPHPGEFERLAGRAVGADPIAAAQDLARESGATVVLKGAPTVVAPAPGGPAIIAREASPALATAGSGDVLAGMIGGLLAQGVAPHEAAAVAVHVGGACVAYCTRAGSARAMLASDMIEALPQVLRERFGDT